MHIETVVKSNLSVFPFFIFRIHFFTHNDYKFFLVITLGKEKLKRTYKMKACFFYLFSIKLITIIRDLIFTLNCECCPALHVYKSFYI